MRACILSVGDELVGGQVVDTNSSYLAQHLAERGIPVVEHCTIGDDEDRIARQITRLAERAELLIVTGGLGPTEDDLTRQALAKATGRELEINERCLAEIEEFFRSRNRQMSPSNRRQAMIPVGAQPLTNTRGTAPGIAARIGKCQIFITPGVPHEMRKMFVDHISGRLGDGTAAIIHTVIHTIGMGESTLAAKIADLMAPNASPSVGTTVSDGIVSVRITSRGPYRQHAEAQSRQTAEEIRKRLGKVVFGQSDQTIASVVGELLAGRGATLATAESCTGGSIGQMITDVPGSSKYYLGGVVAYADAAKLSLLDVPEAVLEACGAVSEPVAAAMATGARARFGSDYAVSVTGIAGPGGGSKAKPVGLVYMGLSGPGGTEVHSSRLTGDRHAIRVRAAVSTLNYLRLKLLEG